MSAAHEPVHEPALDRSHIEWPTLDPNLEQSDSQAREPIHDSIHQATHEPTLIGKDGKMGLANVLPVGVYRQQPMAWRSSDFIFPLLEPILAFGGITSYFLIAFAAKSKHLGTAAFLSAIQALCLAIGNASEESELLKRARKVYYLAARRALPVLKYLDPEPPYKSGTRPLCVLIIPHGLYCIAGKRYWIDAISTGRQKVGKGWCFFADEKLCALSPPMKASARLCGCTKIYPVGNKHVVSAMQKSENCVVFPGGFIEASCTSTTCLRLYTGTYRYWINRCLEHGYDLCFSLIYHGADIWEQGEALFESRLSLAKRGIPGILPTHPRRTPLAVRELFYSPLPVQPGAACADAARDLEARILEDLATTYSKDAARVLELTGKPLKRLEIIRNAREAPPAQSNMSRL